MEAEHGGVPVPVAAAVHEWLAAEGELDVDPMADMRAPHVPEEPVPILTPDDLRALLRTCKGRTFADRRDTAMIRLFVDTGMRLAEMTGLGVDDLDMDYEVAVVLGKVGGRARVLSGRRLVRR